MPGSSSYPLPLNPAGVFMESLHPILRILVNEFGLNSSELAPFRAQFENLHLSAVEVKILLLKYKITTEILFQQALARFYGIAFQDDFSSINPVELSAFTTLIPIRYAKKHLFFPIEQRNGILKVAVEDLADFHPIDDVGRKLGCRIIPVISSHQSILSLINQAYDRSAGSVEAVDNLDTSESFENILDVKEPEDLLDATDEEPIKRLVNSILWQAAKEGASDIHIDPNPKETEVRYRIDGSLHITLQIPKAAHVTIVNRVKVMSRMDIAQKGLPQDGRSMVLVAGKKVDIRVSTLPTVHGEKIVMRLLYQNSTRMQLRDLGLSPNIHQPYEKMIHKSGGIILVTGPTGSGKTTTLYASLAEINHQTKNVITVEDPVEYKVSGYSQVEINHRLGLTFANALRSILRQDPDVIMVGEMRDPETAQIAIQAALTGHLVFSTVHTNNAPATITRLIDMRIEPFLVSSTIIAILAQRLVRRVCDSCRKAYVPHGEQLREIGISLPNLTAVGGYVYQSVGCGRCRNTGYKGRLGIHELLLMNDTIKEVILETNDAHLIKQAALKQGMVSLRMDGASKVLLGLTTIEEVLSITAED